MKAKKERKCKQKSIHCKVETKNHRRAKKSLQLISPHLRGKQTMHLRENVTRCILANEEC